MLKRYLLFCQLTLWASFSTNAQFFAGEEGFFIKEDTPIFMDSLTLIPTQELLLDEQLLEISPIPISGTPPGIARVYRFTKPFPFSGNAGFYYRDSELNGNTENSLQLFFGDDSFTWTTGSVVDIVKHYISNNLSNVEFAALTAGQENSLPVQIADFRVERVEGTTSIYWRTTLEEDASHFEVQNSENGRKWNVLGQVKAVGNRQSEQEYYFSDNVPRRGTQYYRLKMVDLDGSFMYGPVRSIIPIAVESIIAYPNPVSDRLGIDTEKALAYLKLSDITGRTLIEQKNPERYLNLSTYPQGIYLLTVETTDGRHQVLKVFKN